MKFLRFVIAVASGLMAQPATGPQNTTGIPQIQFGGVFGGKFAGSSVDGWTQSIYTGNGSTTTFGSGDAQGGGKGTQSTTPSSVSSSANSGVKSSVFVSGLDNQVNVAGGTGQKNWVRTGNNNFAWGDNQTAAGYTATQDGSGPLSANGGAAATGTTKGSTSQTPTSAQSQVSTLGQSNANQDIPGKTTVSGYGEFGTGSMVGNPNNKNSSFAGGMANGTATYGGGGGQNAAGSLAGGGQTSSKVSPGSVSANASVNSFATLSGGH